MSEMVGNDRTEVAKPNKSASLLSESSRTKELGSGQKMETGWLGSGEECEAKMTI